MPFKTISLGDKTLIVLEEIAGGYTYEQIIAKHPGLTYLDIFFAAREALNIIAAFSIKTSITGMPKTDGKTLSDYRKINPRAYEKWTDEEEEALIELVQAGHGIKYAAGLLQRKPSAIQSRLEKLNSSPTDVSTQG
jgi:hypothetical protein